MKKLILLLTLFISVPLSAAMKVPGDGSDYLSVSQNGFSTLYGDARYTDQKKYNFNYTKITAQGKPTLVNRGIFFGYSLPIYNNDDEELFSCDCIPANWDDTTSVTFYIGGWIDTANTDKKFKLRVSLDTWTAGDTFSSTSTDIDIETDTGTAEQYKSFKIAFPYDAPSANVAIGDAVGIRIRRIDASTAEISGEFVIEGAIFEYTANKYGGSL